MLDGPSRAHVQLDFLLTNREELIWGCNIKGSPGCGGEIRVLRGLRKAGSTVQTLDTGRAGFVLLRKLVGEML